MFLYTCLLEEKNKFIEKRIQSIYSDIIEIENQTSESTGIGPKTFAMISPFEDLHRLVKKEFLGNELIDSLPIYNYDQIIEQMGYFGLLQRLKSCVKEIADSLIMPYAVNISNSTESKINEKLVLKQTIIQETSPAISSTISPNIEQNATIENKINFQTILKKLEQLELESENKAKVLELARQFENEKNQKTPDSGKLRKCLNTIREISISAVNILIYYAQEAGFMDMVLREVG